MTGFHEINSAAHADNIALSKIVQDVGTPCYVYAASVIKSQYEALQSALKKAIPENRQPLLCYACKANSNLAVLSYLRSLGCGLEIVSEGELQRGLRAGFEPEKIVSTGVGKQPSEIEACLKAGIHQINVESLPELKQIQEIASRIDIKAPIVFRLNPDVTGGGHHKISTGRKQDKFGLPAAAVKEGFKLAEGMSHIEPLGLSMHIGSQVSEVSMFEAAFTKLAEIVQELREAGHTITRLDIGGGFPARYKDESLLDLDAYAACVRDIIVPLETEIIMEPGRYLVANAGVLLSEVLYVKETKDRNFLILDAAMNDLLRPSLYDAFHDIQPVENSGGKKVSYDIVGPVCETGDTFATQRELPHINKGDLVMIKSAGAYGYSMASNYNTRALPAEVLVEGDRHEIIRERQKIQDILDGDIIPGWLKD